MKTFQWIWQYLKKYKWTYTLALVLVVVVTIVSMINPLIIGEIVDVVVTEGQTKVVVPMALALIGFTTLKCTMMYVYQTLFEHASQNVIFDIRTELYDKLMRLDFDYYNNTRTGDIMARMTGDTDAIRHFVAWVVYNALLNVGTFIVAIICMAFINVTLTVCLLLLCPFIAVYTVQMRRSISPVFAQVRDAYADLNTVVQENISGNRVVKAFSSEQQEIEKFTIQNEHYKEINLKVTEITGKFLPKLEFLANSLNVIMLLGGGILVINDAMSVGDLVAVSGLLWALNNPMRSAGMLINDTERFLVSSERIQIMLATEPKIKSNEKSSVMKRIRGAIEFDHVSFKYEDVDALRDISFKVEAGQTVGIIGQTGAGKSSLVNLICRFYEATTGKVRVDDVDVRRYNLQNLRDSIAIAMQDIFLFSDTVEANIAYGFSQSTTEKVRQIATVAQADGFIRNMPEGYKTIVGERGVGLSGGQRQRIALARALLKDPAILILDDTTSAVDLETEKKIQEELSREGKKRTTFIIAHRISSVKEADLILVMDKGRIIERGTHEELVAKGGQYNEVYQNQNGSFKA